jgi:tape measure domain-containing protein
MANQNLVARIILRLQDDASRGLATTRQRVSDVGQEMNRVKQIAIGWLSFTAIKSGITNLVELSDKYTNLSGKIKLATTSVQEYDKAQTEDFDIAQRTRTALDSVVGLYTKVQNGIRALGGTQKQALEITEATAQAFKISGATAAASAGGIEQFTQAIQSGVFRGDEFNSVMEAGPRLAQALADGLGVPVAALRGMAEAGELTSERVIAALLSQKDTLAKEYAILDITVGGMWQKLENKALQYIGKSKDANEATHSIAAGIEFVTDHLDGLITIAVHAGEVLLAVFGASKLKGLILYAESMFAARAATAAFVGPLPAATTAVGLFGGAINLVNKALSGLVAWEIGQAIGKWGLQFEWVQYVGANVATMTAKFVAFGELMTHPFSIAAWREFSAELVRIDEHFDGVRTNIGKVDTAPVPTIFERLKTSANSMAEGIDAALTKTKDAAKSHAEEMVKPYDEAAKAITTAFDAQSTQIDADLKNRLYTIDYLAGNEKQKIEETTKAVITAEADKTKAVLQTKVDLDRTWNETYGTAIRLARQAGGDISTLEKQGAEARISSLQTVVNAYQSSVNSMLDEEHRLLDAVRRTKEERENFIRSTEDVIRGLKQKGMTDEQAYADRELQIDEKKAAAKQALLAGNFTEAKRLSDEIIRLAAAESQAIDRESKDDRGNTKRTEAISKTQVLADSIRDVTEAEELGRAALDGQQHAQLTQAKNVATALEGQKRGLAEFKGELERVQAAFNKSAQLKISIDNNSAKDEINKLAALTAAKELSVKIKADPINADQEIADLQAKLAEAKITVPAVVAFDNMRDEELVKIQEELRKSMAFLTAVPVGVDTSDAVATLESMKADIDAKLSAPTEAAHTVKPDFETVFKAINEIKQNTFSTHTVYVNKVENNATGGLIQHLATGGRVAAQTFRRVVGAIKGPGSGTSDDVPVMASNGEFVVKTEAVQHYGVNFMNALNNKQLPVAPGYAIGGAIGDAGAPAGSAAQPSTGQGETINLNFNFGPKTVTLQGSRSAARDLAVELRRLASVS